MIDSQCLPIDFSYAELIHGNFPSGISHLAAQFRVGNQGFECICQCIRILNRHQPAVDTVRHYIATTGYVRSDNGKSTGSCLE